MSETCPDCGCAAGGVHDEMTHVRLWLRKHPQRPRRQPTPDRQQRGDEHPDSPGFVPTNPVTDRTAAGDEEFAALLARVEAAPWDENALRERVARAMWETHRAGTPWESANYYERRWYREIADAALGVLRGEGRQA